MESLNYFALVIGGMCAGGFTAEVIKMFLRRRFNHRMSQF